MKSQLPATMLLVAITTGLASPAVPTPFDAPALGPGAELPVEKRHHYRLHGRIRPLLAFWIGRRDVGRGSIVWRRGEDRRAWALLIGTDPSRAPRALNRWGFIAEQARGRDGAVLALMSRSDERSLEEVRAAERGEGTFVAIRTRVDAGVARSVVSTVRAGGGVTYRDVGRLARQVQAAPDRATPRSTPVPDDVRPGFLAAVAELIEASVAAVLDPATAGPHDHQVPALAYVYGQRLYDLALRSSRLVDDPGGVERLLHAHFEIASRATGSRTRFELTYGVDGPQAGVPVSIRFRPRWWLELELELDNPAM